jgi:hypothetical protein
MKKLPHLLAGMAISVHFVNAHLGQNAISIVNELNAEDVVEMPVCTQEMPHVKLLFFHILADGSLFFWEKGAAVYNNGLARGIAQHIAILFYEIDREGFECQVVCHVISLFSEAMPARRSQALPRGFLHRAT